MILDIQCETVALNNLLYIIKNIMNIIMIVAPILAIIFYAVLFTKLVINPEEKKALNKFKNITLSLVFVFFVPVVVNIVMIALGENTNISRCYNSSKKISADVKYYSVSETDKKSILVKAEDYEKGTGSGQLDFSCKNKKLNANFSCETINIVANHLGDLNYYNFNSVMSRYGGFSKYADSLGGIFSDLYGHKVQVDNVADFQRVSEYVFGYMTMYGFDYYNGNQCDKNGHNCSGKYCKWGGNCMSAENILYHNKLPAPGSNDAFYPGQFMYNQNGLNNKKDFDGIISGKKDLNMTTCCNWAVDMVYYRAGIFGTGRTKASSSANYSNLYKYAKKVVYRPEDLKVGDILAFFHGGVSDGSSPSSWSGWYHAAYVGEVYPEEGIVVVYDGGSYLTNKRSHKWTMKYGGKSKSWVGFRVVELE